MCVCLCVNYENGWIVAFLYNIRGPRQSLLIVRYCFVYWSIDVDLFITAIIIITIISDNFYILCNFLLAKYNKSSIVRRKSKLKIK